MASQGGAEQNNQGAGKQDLSALDIKTLELIPAAIAHKHSVLPLATGPMGETEVASARPGIEGDVYRDLFAAGIEPNGVKITQVLDAATINAAIDANYGPAASTETARTPGTPPWDSVTEAMRAASEQAGRVGESVR